MLNLSITLVIIVNYLCTMHCEYHNFYGVHVHLRSICISLTRTHTHCQLHSVLARSVSDWSWDTLIGGHRRRLLADLVSGIGLSKVKNMYRYLFGAELSMRIFLIPPALTASCSCSFKYWNCFRSGLGKMLLLLLLLLRPLGGGKIYLLLLLLRPLGCEKMLL